ncbi:MAG TPA: hypothetical protein VE110_13205 [Gemmatimonadaceae bacterium]|nr:hypothetical protein [Gemmatimonadaceae bacterium]
MVARRGASRLGCLLSIVVLVLAIYYAFGFGEAYFHAYQYEDAMRSDAEFASTMTDAKISSHMAALADSLGLPPEAAELTITRSPSTISVSADYDQVIKLPFNKEKVLHFHPLIVSGL